jgi:hypothetical protein
MTPTTRGRRGTALSHVERSESTIGGFADRDYGCAKTIIRWRRRLTWGRMLYDSFHRLVVPMVLIAVIGTVWVEAWSQELQSEASRSTWPALPLNREHRSSTTADPSSQSGSFQQVLLKNDQVVSVR